MAMTSTFACWLVQSSTLGSTPFTGSPCRLTAEYLDNTSRNFEHEIFSVFMMCHVSKNMSMSFISAGRALVSKIPDGNCHGFAKLHCYIQPQFKISSCQLNCSGVRWSSHIHEMGIGIGLLPIAVLTKTMVAQLIFSCGGFTYSPLGSTQIFVVLLPILKQSRQ